MQLHEIMDMALYNGTGRTQKRSTQTSASMKPYTCIELGRLFLCQIFHQQVELGRAVLGHARAAQRFDVRQRIDAVRAGTVHESLPMHGKQTVGSKHTSFDTQNCVGSGRIVNYNGGASHGNNRYATV
jgi:hypothetical protein